MSAPVPLAYRIVPPSEVGLVAHPTTRANQAQFLYAQDIFNLYPNVVALVEGSMYNDPAILRYRYLDVEAGIDFPGIEEYANQGRTYSIVDGRIQILRGNRVADRAKVAIQTSFPLIRAGRKIWTREPNERSVWRAGVGKLLDGNMIWAVGHGTIDGFTERVNDLRLPNGVAVEEFDYTDGGHSTTLQARGESAVGFPGSPPVPLYIVQRRGRAMPMPAPAAYRGRNVSPLTGPFPSSTPPPSPLPDTPGTVPTNVTLRAASTASFSNAVWIGGLAVLGVSAWVYTSKRRGNS